jgi:putative transcriptional regulator
MPIHHPSADLLLAVAAGRQSAGVHKVVLAHASLCTECRARLDEFEIVGGAMLDDEKGEALSDSALDLALSALGGEKASTVAVPDWFNAIPPSVREFAAEIARGAGGASSLAMMQAVGADRETTGLVRIEPGKGIPAHAHEGAEYTLVLTGAFRDQRGVFAQGDFLVSDARHTHSPIAEPGETCIAMVVTTAAVRFKGPLGWLQRAMTLGRC